MKVLILDTEAESRDALRRVFSAAGDQVRGVGSLGEAERHLVEYGPDAVVIDHGTDRQGSFLERVRATDPSRGVFVLVDGSRLPTAVSAMERGADDFLWRPIDEGRVSLLRSRLVERREREAEIEQLRLRAVRSEISTALPGRSSPWRDALASLEREAPLESAVLLTGEAGTEKEPAARALHRLSRRGGEPFLVAADWNDLERPRAGEGTLFVPGIEGAPLPVQETLIAEVEKPRGPRLVLSTDLDPREAIANGRLLPALADGLSDHVLHLPPLRERGEDIELLARQLLHELDTGLFFDSRAVDALLAHDWPGNVRELKEVVRRAARLTEGPAIGPTVVTSVLGRPLASRRSRRKKAPVVRIAVGDSLADVERRLIQKTLEFARGNKRKTAELLKLSLKTIYNKIKEYGLEH
jgi:DNA-binding NtrC family response regulator